MGNKEWLESLKVGDKVAYNDRYSSYSIATIERITKTQLVLDNGNKFNRDSGNFVGQTIWNIALITPLTDEIITKIRNKNLKLKVRKIDLSTLHIDKIERILAIVNEVENGK